MNDEIIRKEFKLHKSTIDKIAKLKYTKEQEFPEQKVYDKDIIVEAIDYAYSSKYGKDVFDHTMAKLELVLGNMMKKVLDEYITRIIAALENLQLQDELSKEMLLLILKANDVLPHSQSEINSILMMNQDLDDMVKEAVLFKKQMGE